MGIVAGSTIFNDPLTGPVRDSLAVGATDPIFFLPEMALTAHLVAVVHINLGARLGDEVIARILFMTGVAGKRFVLSPVIEHDIPVGNFSSLYLIDPFIIVALAAFKSFNPGLAGFGPEASPLISGLHQNNIPGKRYGRVNLRLIIKRLGGALVDPGDPAFTAVSRQTNRENQTNRYYPG